MTLNLKSLFDLLRIDRTKKYRREYVEVYKRVKVLYREWQEWGQRPSPLRSELKKLVDLEQKLFKFKLQSPKVPESFNSQEDFGIDDFQSSTMPRPHVRRLFKELYGNKT
jgi:hypothetical protein